MSFCSWSSCRLALAAALVSLALPQAADAAASTASTPSESLRQFLASTRSLKADFTQVVVAKNGRRPQQSTGVFWLARPDRFRWQINAPFAQLLVGDGARIWLYDPDLGQVSVKKQGAALAGTPAALLAGGAEFERQFTLHDRGEQDGLQWVEAVPRQNEGGFERIRLGLLAGELQVMELLDHFGQTTTLRFGKLQRNPELAASLFRFTPPAGVDVLDEAAAQSLPRKP